MTKARQDSDLDGKLPLPSLAQSRLVQIPLKTLYGIGVVLYNAFIDQLAESPQIPVLEPQVVRLPERPGGQADPTGQAVLLKTRAQVPQQLRQFSAPP